MSEAIACNTRVVGEMSACTCDVARERYCTIKCSLFSVFIRLV